LPKTEQIPGDFYRKGEPIKAVVLKVKMENNTPFIVLSRTSNVFLERLFELEVPEVASGAVVIKSIAREPGFRTKIAVVSNEEGVDPIGACVGQRGTRIMAVINELGGEKIDVIESIRWEFIILLSTKKETSSLVKQSTSPFTSLIVPLSALTICGLFCCLSAIRE